MKTIRALTTSTIKAAVTIVPMKSSIASSRYGYVQTRKTYQREKMFKIIFCARY